MLAYGIVIEMKANQTVPNVQKSILELGTVLKEITHRKQFEVEVTRPGLKTSMEKVQVDQEIDRKNLKIKFDVNTELEENLQVNTKLCQLSSYNFYCDLISKSAHPCNDVCLRLLNIPKLRLFGTRKLKTYSHLLSILHWEIERHFRL